MRVYRHKKTKELIAMVNHARLDKTGEAVIIAESLSRYPQPTIVYGWTEFKDEWELVSETELESW